jgi:hypothetical protein
MLMILAGVFLSTFCLTWIVLIRLLATSNLIGSRLEELNRYTPRADREDELQVAFHERVLLPM